VVVEAMVSPIRRALADVRAALTGERTVSTERVLAWSAIGYGAWLLGWWDVYDSVPAAYTVLRIIPEWLVGALFLGHGIAHRRAIRRRDVHQCRRAVVVTMLLWLAVLGALMATVPWSAALPTHLPYALASLWVYSRLRILYPPARRVTR
jgi:hypothetical protein